MIVRHTADAWELIKQSDHGRLAAKFAEQFGELNELTYREQTLKAIAQHDDHKLETNRGATTYVTSWGTPKDFTFVAMDDPIREIEVSRRLQVSYRTHAWIGLLASRHAEHLYRDRLSLTRFKTSWISNAPIGI